MQFIIRLSLSILLGIPALLMVILVVAAGYDTVISYRASRYFHNTSCTALTQAFKTPEKDAIATFYKRWQQTDNTFMEFVDEPLKKSDVSLRDIMATCLKMPNETLYRAYANRATQAEITDKMIDTFNVTDSRVYLDAENAKAREAAPDVSAPEPAQPGVSPSFRVVPTTPVSATN